MMPNNQLVSDSPTSHLSDLFIFLIYWNCKLYSRDDAVPYSCFSLWELVANKLHVQHIKLYTLSGRIQATTHLQFILQCS